MNLRNLASFSIAAVLGVFPLAETSVNVALKLDRGQTLPGLPVGMSVVVTNDGESPIFLSRNAKLTVRSAAGSFEPIWGVSESGSPIGAFPGKEEEWLIVAPHKSVQRAIPVSADLGNPVWFCDSRLSKPAKYEFQIEIEVAESPGQESLWVSSNRVPLTVQKPQGVDASVREMMRAYKQSDDWACLDWALHGFDIAAHVWRRYSDSQYFSFVAAYVPESVPGEKLRAMTRALELDPDGPMVDALLLSIAAYHDDASRNAATGTRDLEKAQSEARKAREALDRVIKRNRPGYVEAAREKASLLLSDTQLREMHRITLAPPGTDR